MRQGGETADSLFLSSQISNMLSQRVGIAWGVPFSFKKIVVPRNPTRRDEGAMLKKASTRVYTGFVHFLAHENSKGALTSLFRAFQTFSGQER